MLHYGGIKGKGKVSESFYNPIDFGFEYWQYLCHSP